MDEQNVSGFLSVECQPVQWPAVEDLISATIRILELPPERQKRLRHFFYANLVATQTRAALAGVLVPEFG
jgi:hypothetical protein